MEKEYTKEQYLDVLKKALDIKLVPYQKIPQLHSEGGIMGLRLRGLYLICSKEENDPQPFLHATNAFGAFDGIRFQGPRLTLEEAVEYLREQKANPNAIGRRIRRAKSFLERKAKAA